jgi:tripartite-type tricarboxylate transporter receptor subunit TctC
MKFLRRQFLHLAAGVATLCIISAIFIAQSGNDARSQTPKTIKIVVPLAAGGGVDILARMLADQIGQSQRTTVVVENRPGASTVIGTEAVARAAPDGTTLLMTQPPLVINPHLRKQNYDPLASFDPICKLVTFPTIIVVNSASPYRTFNDLLNAARARPGELTMAAIPASTPQIAFEMLKRAAKIDMTFVPYPGSAPQVTALLGGHVTAAFAPYPIFSDNLNAGKLRALATLLRIETSPNVPTFAELGFGEIEADPWTGIFAPAKTPKEMLTQLAGWFTAAMQIPAVKSKLDAQQFTPVGTCGSDFAALLRKQYEDFGRVIREANIKAQ